MTASPLNGCHQATHSTKMAHHWPSYWRSTSAIFVRKGNTSNLRELPMRSVVSGVVGAFHLFEIEPKYSGKPVFAYL